MKCGVENIAYNAKGQRLLIAYGNGMMTRYAYDPATFRLLRYRTEGYLKSQAGSQITYAYQAGTTNRQDDQFNYDLVGNILSILGNVKDCGISGTLLGDDKLKRSFGYDAIYRLVSADGRESNTQNDSYLYFDAPVVGSPTPTNVRAYSRTYTYDKLGNVSQVKQFGTSGFTRDFVYNNNVNTVNRINDGSAVLIEDYTYDANGNTLTTNTNRFYKWNQADQLVCYYNQAGGSPTPTVFTQYDYSGQDRVSKLVRTGPNYERTIYIDGIFEYVKLEAISNTYEKNYVHVMDNQTRIAEVRVNVGPAFPSDIIDDVTYHLGDQIGSSAARLSDTGAFIDKEEYYPFGDSSLRTFTYKRYRYVGKERDAESGLYYYGARYYAAWTCRFISIDPLASKYPFYTPYNYAGNKPINKIDIDGMQEGDKGGGGTAEPAPTDGNSGTSAPVDSSYKGTGNLIIKITYADDDAKMNTEQASEVAGEWDYVIAHSLEDANKWIEKTYGLENKEINNLIISTHGSDGDTVLTGSKTQDDITRETRVDVESFNQNNQKRSNEEMSAVNALSSIGSHLADNASVVLSICKVAKNSDLVNSITNALGHGKNINVLSTNTTIHTTAEVEFYTNTREIRSTMISSDEASDPNTKIFDTRLNVMSGRYNTNVLENVGNIKFTNTGQIQTIRK